MQPLPVFSMVVPLKWMVDLNDLWARQFELPARGLTHRMELTSRVCCFFSDPFADNVRQIRATFPKISAEDRPIPGNLSTVELLLSDRWIQAALEKITQP
jgi:hypothetical protein